MEQISKKKVYFRLKSEKNEHHYWILHIQISLSTNFQLKLTVAIFGPNLPKKGSYFQSKKDQIDTTIEFCIFELVFASNFALIKPFWNFGPNLPKEDIYVRKQKSEHHHWIPHIQISLGTKFQFNWQIWFFWPDLPKKSFSGLKQKKLTPLIFHIILHIQIGLVRNFSSTNNFDFLYQICPERYFQWKTEKVSITMEFCIAELV